MRGRQSEALGGHGRTVGRAQRGHLASPSTGPGPGGPPAERPESRRYKRVDVSLFMPLRCARPDASTGSSRGACGVRFRAK